MHPLVLNFTLCSIQRNWKMKTCNDLEFALRLPGTCFLYMGVPFTIHVSRSYKGNSAQLQLCGLCLLKCWYYLFSKLLGSINSIHKRQFCWVRFICICASVCQQNTIQNIEPVNLNIGGGLPSGLVRNHSGVSVCVCVGPNILPNDKRRNFSSAYNSCKL